MLRSPSGRRVTGNNLRISAVHCGVLGLSTLSDASRLAATQILWFKFGTASPLMLRLWRPRPESAFVGTCTITPWMP